MERPDMGYREDYWLECVAIALDEAGVAATDEQIANIAGAVQGAHDCYGMAFGDDVASSNFSASKENEIAALKKAIADEASKVPCPECEGKWAPAMNGNREPARYTCYKCDRTGKVASHLGRH